MRGDWKLRTIPLVIVRYIDLYKRILPPSSQNWQAKISSFAKTLVVIRFSHLSQTINSDDVIIKLTGFKLQVLFIK